jgi:hypothetical protein
MQLSKRHPQQCHAELLQQLSCPWDVYSNPSHGLLQDSLVCWSGKALPSVDV